jgi:hypothetical protein
VTIIRATDEAARFSFETYLSYLGNINSWLRELYGERIYPQLIATMGELPSVRGVQRRETANPSADITRSLRIAWANELRLHIAAANGFDLLPAVLHGAAHDAYYAVYHGARAYFEASRQTVGDRHAAALAALSTAVHQQRLFPVPWSVWCLGGPGRSSMTIGGCPADAPAALAALSSLKKSLYTTRERQIAQKKEDVRLREGRSRVNATTAARMAAQLRATTVFDFMWRLRIRSDYRDAESFLEGISIIDSAVSYHRSISTITSATLATLELLVASYAGVDLYRSAAQGFVGQTNGAPAALQERLRTIEDWTT